ncbi:Glycosyltransferase involved in cell wall bisynthesis [Paraoerskovia marina]|uniref:Glycosyltransferase involved in cell wall bisynthesis n=1 Tax=Paraoerskovia marina TaxID=545619 RepID=A0A1H1QQV8_9CELL|nr:bifunctional glycosyltransferase family 2/GtrA family protein [Paraoerskovia marina]SDS25776.1 Glycosyltransferase involved in cell wall bisynthesis [Paraoerskovia marina]
MPTQTSAVVLIPALEPDHRLLALVADLRRTAPDLSVLVVDDGSGAGYATVFDDVAALGADVVADPVPGNHGKGHALKLGIREVETRYPGADVVCADADGQHTVQDILRVAGHVRPGTAVVGGRRFVGDVPLRSRVGNAVSRSLFRLVTGLRVHDTQTGLRAYPASLLPWLRSIPGERFEYELAVLLQAPRDGVDVDEVEIETVYLDENESSHFRPVVDSLRILAPLIRFVGTGVASFGVDVLMLLLLQALTGSLLLSVVGARIVSGSVNFLLNKFVVFRSTDHRATRAEAARYVALAVSLVVAGYLMLLGLQTLGVALLPAKLLTDGILFFVGWAVQRRHVFRTGGSGLDELDRRDGWVTAVEPVETSATVSTGG